MFTILVPTHQRHPYLERCVTYYGKLGFALMIVDSSDTAYNEVLPDTVQYLHLPGLSFSEKVLVALGHITTPLVALSPDDDFFLPGALTSAADMMIKQPDYSASFGRPVRFNEFSYQQFRWAGSSLPFPRLSGDKRLDIQRYLKRYEQILWALYRKDIIQDAFERIRSAQYENDNFIELTIAAVAVAKGTINPMSGIWMVRETTEAEHWGKLHAAINWQHQTDIERYKEQLAGLISSDYAQLALSAYIDRMVENGLIARYRRFRRFLLKNQLTRKAPVVEGDLVWVDQLLSKYLAVR
ncbi:MAG TPA: TIGR00180 family glycosyltransferase [Rheinheimera sp.]|uniref:TIGR00180 family glycosyltransferase n=1 Tax=Rheinheimera sp. TaxID=1869214 RepID=UPI002B47D154|nr:TIGR00180 family glycosyltransferase [Rheinheimera sp.]HJS14866.1 TIGR00180 family glycosyltransferase [Rheinheimera sp.]